MDRLFDCFTATTSRFQDIPERPKPYVRQGFWPSACPLASHGGSCNPGASGGAAMEATDRLRVGVVFNNPRRFAIRKVKPTDEAQRLFDGGGLYL